MEQHIRDTLIQAAKSVREYAYCPYSQFPVGSAILMNDGRIFTGVNVENVSFGATNCAERSAIFTAVSNGYQPGSVEAIAVSGKTENFLPPCSICRQVMVEFCQRDTPVLLTRNDGEVYETTVGELVPLSFEKLDM